MDSEVALKWLPHALTLLTLIVLYMTWKVMDATRRVTDESRQVMDETLKFARLSKTVDATMHCNDRFDKICHEKLPDVEYYTRFWSHQLDQFNYYKSGVIRRHNLFYWLLSRHIELVGDEQPEGVAPPKDATKEAKRSRAGWEDVKQRWVRNEFITFIDAYVFTEEDKKRKKAYAETSDVPDDVKNRIQRGIDTVVMELEHDHAMVKAQKS